jgi:hypothetical protein
MDFLNDAQGHEDVVDSYDRFNTSDVTSMICFTNKSKKQDLRLVAVSCEDASGEYLGSIVVVGDDILLPGHSRTVAIESRQWKVARFQFHALYREDGVWRAAHSEMFTRPPREIAVNYLGSLGSAESIAQPSFRWDRDYWS